MALSKYGFVLIPDRLTLLEAVALSKMVPDNRLTLDADIIQPHLTVLQTFFKPGFDYRAGLKKLRKHGSFRSEAQTSLSTITTQATSSLEHITWWGVKNADWLKDFNRELIETFEEFIVKPTNAHELTFRSSEAEDSFRRTGYERNLEAYEPHLTLAVTERPVEHLTSKLQGEKIRLHSLAFVEHGLLGELKNVLATEELPVSWDW